MVDLSTHLGRDVASPREILEVIRPHLRHAALIGPVLEAGLRYWPAPEDPDKPGVETFCLDSADEAASEAVFDGLRDDALRNVTDWAKDLDKVFDGVKLRSFVASALNECFNGEPSDAVLDVLDLDEGVCEQLGMVIKALSTSESLVDGTRLAGVAARFFQRV